MRFRSPSSFITGKSFEGGEEGKNNIKIPSFERRKKEGRTKKKKELEEK